MNRRNSGIIALVDFSLVDDGANALFDHSADTIQFLVLVVADRGGRSRGVINLCIANVVIHVLEHILNF